MKKQKNKKNGFYGESIFNLACYNLSRNYVIGKKNTKRVTAQLTVIANYLKDCETSRKGAARGKSL